MKATGVSTSVLLNLGNMAVAAAQPLQKPPFDSFGPYVTIVASSDQDNPQDGLTWECVAFSFDQSYLPSWCS